MPRIPVALQSYQHRSLPISAERIINWMPEQQPGEAKARVVLLPTPGLNVFATPTAGPFRGAHVMGGSLYVVTGVTVTRYGVSAGGVVLGTIDVGAAVSMDDNGTQLVIVVPETGSAWVVTFSTLTQISDPDYLPSTAVTCIDGYHVFSQTNSTTFFISALNDATTYDALDFASAEGSPDNLVAPRRVGRELWLFGEKSAEIWQNSGGGDFPFTRINGAYADRGCAARFSLATRTNTVFWLGDDRVVYRNENANPVRISTHAIEQAIGGYATVSDARGWIYEQEGHTFYVLTFPSAGATWVYDMATQAWHERESEGYTTWRCIMGVAYAGATVAGDKDDGRLYLIDPIASDEAGDTIIRTAIGAVSQTDGKRAFFSSFEADMVTGTGLATGQGSDPQIWLSMSDDGGRTFGSQMQQSFGAQGNYQTRVVWNRLGASRARVFKLEMSDPVRTTLIASNVEVEVER